MRAQIQRTKLFRSLVVERDSTPLHSTPLDSIRIRIEFRFSSLSLSLSDSLSRANATHARILASRADSLQLSSSFYSKNTVAFAITATFRRYFARSRVPCVVFHAGEPRDEEEEGQRKQRARRKGKKEKGTNEKRARDTRFAYLRLLRSLGGRRVAAHRVFSRGRGPRTSQRAGKENSGKTESYV